MDRIHFGTESARDPKTGRIKYVEYGVEIRTRFSGECLIFVFCTEWTVRDGKLEVLVMAPGEDAYGVTVGLTPEQMGEPLWFEKIAGAATDSVAHAALSFALDEDSTGVANKAAIDQDGVSWHIGRRLDERWPKEGERNV
jgi:hypothetical protein